MALSLINKGLERDFVGGNFFVILSYFVGKFIGNIFFIIF